MVSRSLNEFFSVVMFVTNHATARTQMRIFCQCCHVPRYTDFVAQPAREPAAEPVLLQELTVHVDNAALKFTGLSQSATASSERAVRLHKAATNIRVEATQSGCNSASCQTNTVLHVTRASFTWCPLCDNTASVTYNYQYTHDAS